MSLRPTSPHLNAVAAWRETPYFPDAERSALALAESATRLAAITNLFNRLNASARQQARGGVVNR